MQNMNLDCTWTLELLAGVAYARSLWEEPSIKVKVFEACDSRCYVTDHHNRKREIDAITKELVNVVYKKNLPDLFSAYVAHIVKQMGEKIFHWAELLERKFKLKVRNPDAIYWTDLGTIDQVKIFQKCVSDLFSMNSRALCEMVCMCAQHDFIKDHVTEIKELSKTSSKFNYSPIDCLIACTFFYVNKNFQDDFKWEESWIDPGEKSETTNLFCLAVTYGFDSAAKYYWGQMDVIDQEENIMLNCKKCLELCEFGYCSSKFIQEKYVEISMFLMSKMSEDQIRKLVVGREYKILFMFLSVWPAQNFFIPLLNAIKASLSSLEYIKILINISCYLEKDMNLGLNATENFYYGLFQVVWHNFTKCYGNDIKTKSLKKLCEKEESNLDIYDDGSATFYGGYDQSSNFKKIISPFFRMFHLQGLKLIINDKHLTNERDVLINVGEDKFKELIEQENIKMLNRFVEIIFNSDEEKQNFKLSLNFCEYLIENNKLNSAVKLVNWQLSLKDDKKKWMNSQLNYEEICRMLIRKGKCDTAESFLKWVFETEEEKENFKNIFKSDDFVKEVIYGFWASSCDIPSAEGNSDNFLKWILVSEDKINQFKKEKLLENFECVALFFIGTERYSISLPERFERFERFLVFCEVTKKKIAKIKKDLIENVRKLVLPSKLQVHFSDYDYLLTWAADSSTHKEVIIKKLLDSVDILLIFKRIEFADAHELFNFYHEWIEKYPNITKLKNEVLSRKDEISEEYYLHLKNLYEKLENGYEIGISDVVYRRNDYYESLGSDYETW